MEKLHISLAGEDADRKELFHEHMVKYGKLANGEITSEELKKANKLSADKIKKLNDELKKMKNELREAENVTKNLNTDKYKREMLLVTPFNTLLSRSKAI